jgi:voltage-gated potassium channel
MDDESDSQIIDENKDFLDDRIVKPKESEGKETAPNIAKRIGHLHLFELPEKLLRKMLEDIEIEQKRLSKQASEIEKSLHKELLRGNASILDEKKKDIRLIEREFEDLDDDRQNIYDALQQNIVTNGMMKVLGGKKMLYASEGLIFLLIILVLGLLTYEFLYLDPELDKALVLNIFYIDTLCCGIFLTEFTLRYRQAEDKRWYWRNHWIDFLTSIPIPPVTLFDNAALLRYGRSLRMLRILRVLRIGRAVRIIFFFWRGMDKISEAMNVKLMKKSIRGLVLAIIFGAVLILYFEGENDPNVNNLGQSIWWSFTTVVTSGFGDIYNPQSSIGRLLTVILIIIGMIVVGVFTATLTSLYVEEGTEELQIMQRTLDERFTNLANSHEQGSRERQQGIEEREALDRNLRDGLEQIFANQKEMAKNQKEMAKKIEKLES